MDQDRPCVRFNELERLPHEIEDDYRSCNIHFVTSELYFGWRKSPFVLIDAGVLNEKRARAEKEKLGSRPARGELWEPVEG